MGLPGQFSVTINSTGNSSRKQPATYSRPCPKEKPPELNTFALFFDCEHSRGLYQQIQTKALDVFPALSRLDKKYYNGTGFLSYHEAEILTQTLLKLKSLGVVAYGVHDCIIVKQSDQDVAVKTYRSVIHDYALAHQKRNKLPELKLEACVSIEQSDKEDVVLEGRYFS